MLELKHISKRFEEHLIIDDVSLVLPDCGMVGIQGTSGCGKSTLLYIIGMLDDDFAGEIFYNGEKVMDRSEFISQNISYMMQNKDFISALTIKENITLASQVSQFDYSPAILQKITTQLSIQDLLKRYPHQLSGGQLKRASIAKAMLKQSPIILCDEPTGALHSQQAQIVMQELKKLSLKSLVIIVSHDPLLLKQYCDSVLTLENAKLKGRLKKTPIIQTTHPQPKTYSMFFYSFKQLLYQRNKLLFLFLFQWIVIVAFFLIVTAMNGVFDAISESEKSSVQVNMMTIEKKDSSAFEELITHLQIKNVTYDYSLEQLQWSYQNKDITCFISFLPIQTSHIQLSKGRLPQNSHEIILSLPLYQTLKQPQTLTCLTDTKIEMQVVGVLEEHFFTQEEIYCSPLLQNELSAFKDMKTLCVEAKEQSHQMLYKSLSQDYFVYSDVIERVENYQSILSLARLIAYVFIGISFFVSLLLIGIVESTIYYERTHDVAYLLSLGMKRKRLFVLSIIEALSLGIMMAIGGCLLSAFLYFYFNNVYLLKEHFGILLSLHPILLSQYDLYGFIFICYMLMTMLGALLPTRKMMSINMIDVLREE
ncbi:MAG: ATP-binding cassette domain-containing protein [Longibaculum muris]|uniref:ABC-type lipoprotein export system ATPase subunit n=1 Tax=Longibaculum muris TaxID=1796628 RepID=A0A4V2W4R8_9FIRM|nr:ATP-binding cassette domain-containing protein [Longibaculum muris]KXU47952.1 ABC transporter, ATP-binding protein [Candidatus Stoquefichus sp. KLE1796]MBS5368513.1 ATP-binding cassette domain-containing protein [Coprobacillus cateniformis]MCR1888710.1 ATP-binding cassette domain-containing protein [Longibaculum muris]MED9812214.1 ATP-binding cassette domain-containing protein [Longibaculum muris]TCV96949.1 ABC-type lipoprotein export system ATPase subunit [Longibaculum muris]